MHARKILTAKLIYIICQLFSISAALGESDDAPAFQTFGIDIFCKLFPDGILSSAQRRSQAVDLDMYLLLHMGSYDAYCIQRQIISSCLQRLNRRRQPDALQLSFTQLLQSCDRKHKMCTAFCINERMQLIDDQCLCRV